MCTASGYGLYLSQSMVADPRRLPFVRTLPIADGTNPRRDARKEEERRMKNRRSPIKRREPPDDQEARSARLTSATENRRHSSIFEHRAIILLRIALVPYQVVRSQKGPATFTSSSSGYSPHHPACKPQAPPPPDYFITATQRSSNMKLASSILALSAFSYTSAFVCTTSFRAPSTSILEASKMDSDSGARKLGQAALAASLLMGLLPTVSLSCVSDDLILADPPWPHTSSRLPLRLIIDCLRLTRATQTDAY